MKMHLFLTGFMGVGKTSVGQILAAELGVPFIDLDQLITETVGRSIAQIFSKDGELVFRELESSALATLSHSQPSVVSTGGGIIGRPENLSFMHSHGTVVYLSADWETLKQRIGDTQGRPLAKTDDDWSATRALWLARKPLYEKADLIVSTEHRTLPDIVSDLRCYIESQS